MESADEFGFCRLCQPNKQTIRVSLHLPFAILKAAAASSRNQLHNYYSNSEIKWKSVMKVDGLEKQADDVSKKLRELNTAIQAANWNGDIPD